MAVSSLPSPDESALDQLNTIAAALPDPQRDLPRLARDSSVRSLIEAAILEVPTSHRLLVGDARDLCSFPDKSVHLVVTSPPYWTLKKYNERQGQLGHLADYESFLDQLDLIWTEVYRLLVPGGRLICVVGDVCLSRRRNGGRHTVVPLHASIEERCRQIGFDGLAPVIWHKISNAVHEVDRPSAFLGKPYEPNSVIKNDIEFILMQRRPGGYRAPTIETRLLSLIPASSHKRWFNQIWTDIRGESTRRHPAPYPLELVDRLIRMFSFVGDTVLDPFTGTGTTSVAAALAGRSSIGIDIDPGYLDMAHQRLAQEAPPSATIEPISLLAPSAQRIEREDVEPAHLRTPSPV
jgi:DNA modification methylase